MSDDNKTNATEEESTESSVAKRIFMVDRLSNLKSGVRVNSDVYAYNRDILLVRAGAVLDDKKLEALQRINNFKDIVNIAFESREQIIEYQLSCKIVDSAALEDETGYTELKNMTEELIEELVESEMIEESRADEMSEVLCYRLESTSQEVILNLINALGPVDEYLPRHCVEVGMLCGLLGRWLGYSKDEVDNLVKIGLLHDCGKASTPKEVLCAPRKLSTSEFEVIKMHPIYSSDMLQKISDDVRLAARYHHERVDGSGYPDGIRGDEIPILARIVAVCDIYDAMVSRRSYKEPENPFTILKALETKKGIELDAALVDVFIKNMLGDMIGKPVLLSDGEVAVVHDTNPKDIEHPVVRTANGIIKTGADVRCKSMYYADMGIGL